MSEAKVQFQVVMFIDIPTAAHIREAEGGSAERSFLDRCVSILSVVRKQHDGVLVRTVGEESRPLFKVVTKGSVSTVVDHCGEQKRSNVCLVHYETEDR